MSGVQLTAACPRDGAVKGRIWITIMTVNPNQEARIRAIAEKQGRLAQEVLDDIVQAALDEQEITPRSAESQGPGHVWRWLEFVRELDKLPITRPDDDFDPRKHDEVIYRIDW